MPGLPKENPGIVCANAVQARCLPVARPTASKYWKVKITNLLR